VGMTAHGVDRVAADKAQTYCPRLEGLAPWFFAKASCPDTYELLNKYPLSADSLQIKRRAINAVELSSKINLFALAPSLLQPPKLSQQSGYGRKYRHMNGDRRSAIGAAWNAAGETRPAPLP
jgi:hypothetical protein